MTPFAVPVAAKELLVLVCQLRDGERDAAWQAFANVVASGQHELLATAWEQAARLLGLTVTGPGEPAPVPHAVRESYCVLSNRCAWRT